MQAVLRFVGLVMIRVYYRTIALLGAERVPARGPVVVVANHPNGLLDPLVARVALQRPLGFLAKSTMWGNPFGRLAMTAFDAIAVHRPKDGADTRKNEDTFRTSRERLTRGGWLMLFPEGISHSATTLQPLKTGAARIILSANLPTIRVLPLGLVYDDKQSFRSRVVVNVGQPIDTAPYLEQAAVDERAAVRALTERIGEAVSSVMLQAEDAEIWNGLFAVAAWTSDAGDRSLVDLTERAKRLEAAYRELVIAEPTRAQQMVDRARRFAFLLRSVGVDDPFALEDAAVLRPARLLRFAVAVALLSPLVAVGLVASGVPYHLVRLVASRGAETDVISTIKAIAGIVLFPLFWIGEAIALLLCCGPPIALAALASMPLASFVTLRVRERFNTRREALGGWWLRMSQAELAGRIADQRRALAIDVEQILGARPGGLA